MILVLSFCRAHGASTRGLLLYIFLGFFYRREQSEMSRRDWHQDETTKQRRANQLSHSERCRQQDRSCTDLGLLQAQRDDERRQSARSTTRWGLRPSEPRGRASEQEAAREIETKQREQPDSAAARVRGKSEQGTEGDGAAGREQEEAQRA
jgi:hypothetical protein